MSILNVILADAEKALQIGTIALPQLDALMAIIQLAPSPTNASQAITADDVSALFSQAAQTAGEIVQTADAEITKTEAKQNASKVQS